MRIGRRIQSIAKIHYANRFHGITPMTTWIHSCSSGMLSKGFYLNVALSWQYGIRTSF